jgi:hypothetical protein
MSRALVCAAVVALFSVPSAAAALPQPGSLVPGRSLGGIHLGETAAGVRAALGHGYGICQGCSVATWYFTYRRFEQRGLAVELTQGRVSAVYTLWQPNGWSAPRGLQLGAVQAQVTSLAGGMVVITCTGYEALVRETHGVQTAYYIVDGKLWGFGLLGARKSPCR